MLHQLIFLKGDLNQNVITWPVVHLHFNPKNVHRRWTKTAYNHQIYFWLACVTETPSLHLNPLSLETKSLKTEITDNSALHFLPQAVRRARRDAASSARRSLSRHLDIWWSKPDAVTVPVMRRCKGELASESHGPIKNLHMPHFLQWCLSAASTKQKMPTAAWLPDIRPHTTPHIWRRWMLPSSCTS